jgi:hypothetical protein
MHQLRAEDVKEKAWEKTVVGRCPHTPIVARSCFNPDGSIEVIWPHQSAEIMIPVPMMPIPATISPSQRT